MNPIKEDKKIFAYWILGFAISILFQFLIGNNVGVIVAVSLVPIFIHDMLRVFLFILIQKKEEEK